MTLVEVIIALFVFAVGVIAVSLMIGNAIRYSSSARWTVEAAELAQHKMEFLLSVPYHHNQLDSSVSPYGPVVLDGYELSWSVRDDVPLSRMKTISMTVSWNDHGREKTTTLTAIRQ